jgi:predicted XRE-type DNA-binding protein
MSAPRSKGVKTTGNVFKSLGFPSAEAENLRVRAFIMNALIGHIEERKLTQAQTAKILGITQPRVSDLLRGKIDLFSIDRLVNLLAAAGLRVDLRVRKAA